MEENNEFKNPENVENSNNVDSNNNQPQKSTKAKKIIAGVACVVVVSNVLHVVVVTGRGRRVVDDVSQGVPFACVVVVCNDLIYGHGACSR